MNKIMRWHSQLEYVIAPFSNTKEIENKHLPVAYVCVCVCHNKRNRIEIHTFSQNSRVV